MEFSILIHILNSILSSHFKIIKKNINYLHVKIITYYIPTTHYYFYVSPLFFSLFFDSRLSLLSLLSSFSDFYSLIQTKTKNSMLKFSMIISHLIYRTIFCCLGYYSLFAISVRKICTIFFV